MSNIFIIASILFSMIAISNHQRGVVLGIVLTLIAFASPALSFSTFNFFNPCFFYFSNTVMFLYIIIQLLKTIFYTKKVNSHIILASLCIYFMIAMVWAMISGLIEWFIPGSYNFMMGTDIKKNLGNLMYFSMVTLTTLGFGDMLPLSMPARTFTAMEALTGQLYLTVLVARLVSLHSKETPSSEQ
ncbi:MAG: ion channel [Cyanobacteria bacterium P01_H01_bin.74]